MICASLLREYSSRRKLRLNGMKLRAGSASSRVWRETALVIFLSDRGFAGEAGMSLGKENRPSGSLMMLNERLPEVLREISVSGSYFSISLR